MVDFREHCKRSSKVPQEKTNKVYDREEIEHVLEWFPLLSPERTQDIVVELLDIIIEHVDIESLSKDEFKAFEGAHYSYLDPGDDIHQDMKIFDWVMKILKSLVSGQRPPIVHNPDFKPDAEGLPLD